MKMSDQSYQLLADALEALPSGFPRTASGAELRILRKHSLLKRLNLPGI